MTPSGPARSGWRKHRGERDDAGGADQGLHDTLDEAAEEAVRQRLKAWRLDTDHRRKALEAARRKHRKKVKAARADAKQAAAPQRLAGGPLLPVTVTETHVVIGRQQFPLEPGINATVDSSGNISRSRRYTATRTLMFGVGTLFMPKATKHDDRELFLLIESPHWAQVVKLDANKQVAARKLAQSIVLASNNAEQHQQRFAARRAEGEAALQAAIADVEAISTAEQALRDVDAQRRAETAAAVLDLQAALDAAGEEPTRKAVRARKLLDEATTAIGQPLEIPPSPDLHDVETDEGLPAGEESIPDADNEVLDAVEIDEAQDVQAQDDVEPDSETLASSDPFAQIRQLGELRDAGLITEDQFEAKRTEILGRI